MPGNGNARLCFEVSDVDEAVEQLHALGVYTSDVIVKKDDPRDIVESALLQF